MDGLYRAGYRIRSAPGSGPRPSEYIFTALLIAALTFLLNAVMIPTQMKFGETEASSL